MIVREITDQEKDQFDQAVNHPLQSWAWGEFREQTGVKVKRLGVFEDKKLVNGYQVSIHPIPKTQFTIGYFPKGPMPDKTMLEALKKLGEQENCIFIKLEPNVSSAINKDKTSWKQIDSFLQLHNCRPGRPLFTKYTFQIDLTKTEAELLAQMKAKTRYNVHLAERKGVKIVEDSTPAGLAEYLKLRQITLNRQNFYDHTTDYKQKMWQQFRTADIAHLLKAVYKNQTLAAWIVFKFKDKLYYPYGASSNQHREVMASSLIMWEVMRFGKKNNCQVFDTWGSLGPNPDKSDPWYGFHRFKLGFGGQLVEFLGTYDLVIKPSIYPVYRLAEKIRWQILRLWAKLKP